jgi:hypothetical protein
MGAHPCWPWHTSVNHNFQCLMFIFVVLDQALLITEAFAFERVTLDFK